MSYCHIITIFICICQDKTFGKIIQRHGGILILYRGRNYNPTKRPFIPLMLWKPQEPIYPRLIKTTIEGLSIEETKEMRKRGLAVPALTKLGTDSLFFLASFTFIELQVLFFILFCSWNCKFFYSDSSLLNMQQRMAIMVVLYPWSEMLFWWLS